MTGVVSPTFSHIFKRLGKECKLCQDMAKYAYKIHENCFCMSQPKQYIWNKGLNKGLDNIGKKLLRTI